MDRIDALSAFLRLADGATFAEAAHALRVRQSTVSKWLARLEDELGVQLMERTTRARRLTAAGERFAARARTVVEAYDDAVRVTRPADQGLQGRIRVSLPVVLGERLLVPVLNGFLTRHPQVEAELVFSDRYVDLIDEGIDVAFRVGRPLDSSMRARTLVRGRRLLVASPRFVAQNAIAHPRDLETVQCLLHAGRIARDVWQFEREELTHRAAVGGGRSANHSGALLALAQAGQGVALLVEWLVADAIRAGTLVQLLPEWRLPAAPLRAVMPPRRFVNAAVQALVTHVAAELPSSVPRARKQPR